MTPLGACKCARRYTSRHTGGPPGILRGMPSPARSHYDHRIRQAIVKTGDADLFPKLDIPSSTRRSWIRRGELAKVVALAERDDELIELHATVSKLERKVAILTAVVRLLVTMVRVTGVTLSELRLPSASAKRRVLRAITSAEHAIGRTAAMRVVGLTPARAREWTTRELRCALEDAPPCPRSVPGRLTLDERRAMRQMVEAEEYKHVSLRSLALLGRRLGKVFAAYGTWCRQVREHGGTDLAAASTPPTRRSAFARRRPTSGGMST